MVGSQKIELAAYASETRDLVEYNPAFPFRVMVSRNLHTTWTSFDQI